MIDLLGNRRNEKYTYREVDYLTWTEGRELGNVTGGSFELSAFSDLKATCSFSFVGEAPAQDSLVRVYYDFDDDNGEHFEQAIGTFIVYYSTVTYIDDGLEPLATGTADCYSVLKVLQDKLYGVPYTIPAGTNLVSYAAGIIAAEGLRYDAKYVSSYVSQSDYTFDKSDNLLTIVNWCLTTANFRSAIPAADGSIILTRYEEPSEQTPIATFANDANSILYPQPQVENDWQSTPNAVVAYYESSDMAIYAQATNVSGSKASTSARNGREVTLQYDVTELEGSTSADKLANLKEAARVKLLDNSSEIEYVYFSHPYIPIRPYDSIRIDYGSSTWTGTVTNMSCTLSVGTKCETSIRRYVSSVLNITLAGSVLWVVA